MDIVGTALVCTFIAMMGAGALLVRDRRPPIHRRQIRCPEDQAVATVALSWEPGPRRMIVADCDHRLAKEGGCRKACEAGLQNAFPEMTPTTVMP